jgi:hypothetical protein
MIIEIRPEDSLAHSLPAIGFRVDTGRTGLGGRPFASLGLYLTLSGPPGGPLSFCVSPALERESDAVAVEREVFRQLGDNFRKARTAAQGHVFIAGASRPAITYTAGEGFFSEATCATLVGTPAGSLLVAVSIGWSGKEAPRCVDVAEDRRLRELIQSFTLLDGISPPGPGPQPYPFDPDALRKYDDVLGSARDRTLRVELLLGLRPEELIGTVFEEPQPTPGVGVTRLACARQLAMQGVPQEALSLCIRAWQAAREGLGPGPVPDARLVRLDSDLAQETLGAPKLGRWMAALRGRVTSTRTLELALHFLDDVRTVWADLVAQEQGQSPDQSRPGPPPAQPAKPVTRPSHGWPEAPSALAGENLSRTELLAITPESLMVAVFATPGPSPEIGTAGLVLAEQLRAANVPLEALELCIVFWSAALDGLAPGSQVPADRLAHLDRSLAIQTHGFPVLARWMAALRQRVSSAETLDLAIQFLLRARTTWVVTDAMRAARPATGSGDG